MSTVFCGCESLGSALPRARYVAMRTFFWYNRKCGQYNVRSAVEYAAKRYDMDKIASFTVDHLRLLPGLYVSRKDSRGDVMVTTFDLRFTAPNREPVMDMPAVHTIEHLGATVLRNGASKDDIVYFGPMGCRTGFYLIVFGDKTPADVYGLIVGMCEFILGYDGEIPGAKAAECGNYLEQNLSEAKYYVRRYLNELKENKRYDYPTATE